MEIQGLNFSVTGRRAKLSTSNSEEHSSQLESTLTKLGQKQHTRNESLEESKQKPRPLPHRSRIFRKPNVPT